MDEEVAGRLLECPECGNKIKVPVGHGLDPGHATHEARDAAEGVSDTPGRKPDLDALAERMMDRSSGDSTYDLEELLELPLLKWVGVGMPVGVVIAVIVGMLGNDSIDATFAVLAGSICAGLLLGAAGGLGLGIAYYNELHVVLLKSIAESARRQPAVMRAWNSVVTLWATLRVPVGAGAGLAFCGLSVWINVLLFRAEQTLPRTHRVLTTGGQLLYSSADDTIFYQIAGSIVSAAGLAIAAVIVYFAFGWGRLQDERIDFRLLGVVPVIAIIAGVVTFLIWNVAL